MAEISQKEAKKAIETSERLKRSISKVKEDGKAALQAGLRTGAGMGSAFAVTYIERRYPENNKVLGLDLSLLIGVVATAAGAFGMAGDKQTNEIIEAVGNGSLFAFAAKKGGEMGSEALAKV